MEDENKHIIAEADIDGEVKKFYREGIINEFYTYKHYSARDIKSLRNEIKESDYRIRFEFKRVGYFYSDEFGFCKLYLPEVICYILEQICTNHINACGQGSNFIVYTDKIDYIHARNRFNDHFNGNL